MDSEANLHLIRAESEFLLAENDMKASTDFRVKEILGLQKNRTFFHSVIAHAYYAIFNCAKAYLKNKGIKTKAPEEHKKTLKKFSELVNNGILDKELLKIYEEEAFKADSLLHIFKTEKKKRGVFTYNIKSEANLPYARESIENARKFISTIKNIL